jgi:hypothetical protein
MGGRFGARLSCILLRPVHDTKQIEAGPVSQVTKVQEDEILTHLKFNPVDNSAGNDLRDASLRTGNC